MAQLSQKKEPKLRFGSRHQLMFKDSARVPDVAAMSLFKFSLLKISRLLGDAGGKENL